MEDYEFQNADSGASGCENTEAGRLKAGSLVMIKEKPCKVTHQSHAKTGKHGSAKVMLTGEDIFTHKKYECTYGSGDMVPAPLVTRKEYTLIDIDEDDFMMLMDEVGNIKEDVKLPEHEWCEDFVKTMKSILAAATNECLVVVISALGQEQATSAREGKAQ